MIDPPPLCFKCREVGHIRRNCNMIKCKLCKRQHDSNLNCHHLSYANITKSDKTHSIAEDLERLVDEGEFNNPISLHSVNSLQNESLITCNIATKALPLEDSETPSSLGGGADVTLHQAILVDKRIRDNSSENESVTLEVVNLSSGLSDIDNFTLVTKKGHRTRNKDGTAHCAAQKEALTTLKSAEVSNRRYTVLTDEMDWANDEVHDAIGAIEHVSSEAGCENVKTDFKQSIPIRSLDSNDFNVSNVFENKEKKRRINEISIKDGGKKMKEAAKTASSFKPEYKSQEYSLCSDVAKGEGVMTRAAARALSVLYPENIDSTTDEALGREASIEIQNNSLVLSNDTGTEFSLEGSVSHDGEDGEDTFNDRSCTVLLEGFSFDSHTAQVCDFLQGLDYLKIYYLRDRNGIRDGRFHARFEKTEFATQALALNGKSHLNKIISVTLLD